MNIPKILIFAKNFSGKYILGNHAFLQETGLIYDKHLIGRHEHDICSEVCSDSIGGIDKLVEEFLIEDEHVFRGKELNILQVYKIRGKIKFFIANKLPYKNEKQKIMGAVCSHQEIINPFPHIIKNYLSLENENFQISEQSKEHIHWYMDEFHKSIVLNKRELECVNLLTKGFTAKEIARRLDLSHRTIESYLDNAKTKLNCTSSYELLVKCFSLGWLESHYE